MDKNQKTLFASILIIILLIVSLVGYTFAEYDKKYPPRNNALSENWQFYVTGWNQKETKEIKLQDTLNMISLENGKIAPGTAGQFEIEINTINSDEDVEYHVEVSEEGTIPENMIFKIIQNDESNSTNYANLTELANAELTGIISKKDKVKCFTINWEWPYENYELVDMESQKMSEDAKDSKIGTGIMEGSENVFDYTAYITVVGSQVRK